MAVTKDHKVRLRITKQEALELLFPGENLQSIEIEYFGLDPEDQSYVVAEKVREAVV